MMVLQMKDRELLVLSFPSLPILAPLTPLSSPEVVGTYPSCSSLTQYINNRSLYKTSQALSCLPFILADLE